MMYVPHDCLSSVHTSVPIGLSSGTEKWRTNLIGAMIGTHKRGKMGE